LQNVETILVCFWKILKRLPPFLDHRDRENGKLRFSRQKYVEKVLVKFGLNNEKPVNIPLASHIKLSSGLCPSSKKENDYISCVAYANPIRKYAMVCTR